MKFENTEVFNFKCALKNKISKLKRVLFSTSSQRKVNNEVPEWAENAVSQMNLEMLLED